MDVHKQGFRLEELRIEPRTGDVTGPGGVEKLDPKVMDVLVVLAGRAGEVVTREELHTSVWPDAVVTDDALTRCFYELRRQLSRAGGDDRYRRMLETLPKRGYRLNGKVTPTPETRRWKPAAAAIGILALAGLGWFVGLRGADPPVDPSIAVLPFADMSEDQDQQYIADGVAEEILDRLAKNPGALRVIGRTSSFAFRNTTKQVPEIASQLNVNHLLEGSVRRSGDRIRITVQLIEGAGATHLWSETYERKLGELFAVQDEIASAVAAALQVALATSSPASRTAVQAESQDDFLRARFFYERRASGDVERSIEYLEAAVARDPQFARAWELLSGAYNQMWWDEERDPAIWIPRQAVAAREAVELDPQLPEARIRLGQYHLDVSDREKAIEQFEAAAKHDPNDPWLVFLTRLATQWHSVNEELELRNRRDSVHRDPMSTIKRTNLALLLFREGHLDEALAEFERARELNPNLPWDKELEVGRILVAQKRYAEAKAKFLELPVDARDYGLVLLYHAPGQRDLAEAALSRLQARTVDSMPHGPNSYIHGIWVAEALVLRSRVEESFAALRRGRDELARDQSILIRLYFYLLEMRNAPFLHPLHGYPEWREMLVAPEGNSAQEIIEYVWPST